MEGGWDLHIFVENSPCLRHSVRNLRYVREPNPRVLILVQIPFWSREAVNSVRVNKHISFMC